MTVQYQRSDDFVYRRVAGEHLLLALRRDRIAPMFMLTPTGGFVWDQLTEWTPLSELVARVVDNFEVSEEVAASDVATFLEQLKGLGAVTTRTSEP